MKRRAFLGTLALTPPALAAACNDASGPASDAHRLATRRADPTSATAPGSYPLGIEPGLRDGFLYVPSSYVGTTAAPMMVLLHGATGSAAAWGTDAVKQVADDLGMVIMAPSSRDRTWDVILTEKFGPDVTFIDAALEVAFRKCNIDAARIALAGFSDGATYALSLGASNGDFFSNLLGFSPGYWLPAEKRGRPPVFITHGASDSVLPVTYTRNEIVPQMRSDGYTVEYTEFVGGHSLSAGLFEQAAGWFVNHS